MSKLQSFFRSHVIFLHVLMVFQLVCSEKLSTPLHDHLLLSLICPLKSDIFPYDWKNSHIIPIPKYSSALSSPTAYHPISLLPLISKVLERHIFNWLVDFCQTHNILSWLSVYCPIWCPSRLESWTTSLHFVCEWHIPVTFLLNFIYHLIWWWHHPWNLLAV